MTKLIFDGKSMLDIQRLLRGQNLTLIRAYYRMRRQCDQHGTWQSGEIIICLVVPNI